MEQIVVQTEVQPDGNILLFYVDENQEIDPNLLEQVDDESIEVQPETKYIIEDTGGDSENELDIAQATQRVAQEHWPDNEIRRLIVFYTDNKKTFQNGTTKSKHLWAVACKTMLTQRDPISCEIKFRMLKSEYIEAYLQKQKDTNYHWPFYDLCHQAFYDDPDVVSCLNESLKVSVSTQEHEDPETMTPTTHIVNEDGVIIVKKVSNPQCDEKVISMLNIYIKHKGKYSNASLSKSIWDTIALEMGEEDKSYWHRRFYNFKKHYISMLHKKQETNEDINWPYMSLFDKIFSDDIDFQRKFQISDNKTEIEGDTLIKNIWYDTQKLFLVKYRFDSFHEFQDPTIPETFLWHEVGRLLGKDPESCKNKLEELQDSHVSDLLAGNYDLSNRRPLQILLDNLMALEVRATLTECSNTTVNDPWKTEQIDELVQFLYDNLEIFKDSVCYYVCWFIVAKKLDKTVLSCKKKWNELTDLYRSILSNKRENPDMQIDWRYIFVFDIIFDYGMDLKLLDGYEIIDTNKTTKSNGKTLKVVFNEDYFSQDQETYDERGFMKSRKKQAGDEKAFKLLEYYLKNKDKFSSPQQKKLSLWEVIGKQIGMSATECSHRFRNLKQVYTAYVQREVNKPEMPILWPYYALCKKVFGYRAVKAKLKSGKTDVDDIGDWAPKEIKEIINHFSTFFNEITQNSNDDSPWASLAGQMGRPASSLRDKFLELRKSYKKLRTMKSRNPDVKVTWKYFNIMDNIYKEAEEVNSRDRIEIDIPQSFDVIGKTELPDDDEYQCIIVMPENEEIIYEETIAEDIPQITPKTEVESKMFKWNKSSKRLLLSLYIECLQRKMKPRDIWNEIADKMDDKTPKACRNMFVKLKNNHNEGNIVYSKLFEKILALQTGKS